MSRLQDVILRGLRSAQPLPADVSEGALYYVTDEQVTERSTGAAWESVTDGTVVAADSVTYAKMQNVSAASKLLGRGSAAGAGDPQEITLGTGLSMSGTTLNGTAATGTVDTSGTPAAGNLAKFTDADTISNADLTGDVTTSGGVAATIPANTVTYAKMQDVSAASKLLGRGAGAGAGDPQEITLGTGLSMSGSTLNATGGGAGTVDTSGTPATGNLAKFSDADTITNADLTGDVTTSGGVAATIANDAVSYAKMQNVSAASKLLGRGDSGSGDPQEITLGTGLSMSGTTLSASGGGGGVSGGGALVLLEQHTASASASLDFTSWYSSEYDEYVIEFVGLVPATDNAALWMRMSTNGGTSYDSAANYSSANFSFHEGATGVGGGGTAQTKIVLNGGYTSTANYKLNGSARLFDPAGSGFKAVVGATMARFSSADAHRIQYIIHGQYDITTAVNALQFLNSTGNIASGTIRIYGVRKAIAPTAGALVLLEQHTAANQATLDFTTAISSTYDEYVIEIVGLVPATDAVDLYWRFSTDGGSTYDATAKYVSTILAWINTVTATAGEDPAGAVAQFAMRKSGVVSNNAAYGVDGKIRLAIPGGSKFPRCIGDFGFLTNASVAQAVTHRGIYISATAINAFRFLFSSGNISSGTIRVYGVTK